jgi:hypothetical protein
MVGLSISTRSSKMTLFVVQMHLNLQSTEVQIGVWVEMLRIIKEYLPFNLTFQHIMELEEENLSHACFANFGSSFSFFK